MNLMECRLNHLKQTLAGLIKTGIPLIEYDGKQLLPSITADDIGIYVIIPKLAVFLGISLDTAISLFFYGILLLPALFGILGFFYYYKNWVEKILALFAILLLTRQANVLGGTYLTYFASVVALVPWALYFAKKNSYNNALLFYLFFSGFTISTFHYIRSYSGIGTAFFIATLLYMSCHFTKKQIMSLFFAFLCGSLIPLMYFNHSYRSSARYAKMHLNDSTVGQKRHVFWHNIYIGFGFLKHGNTENIVYDDSFGFNKALEHSKITLEQTDQYENIIKNEILNLVKNHWQFVIFTIFAKIGILLFYLLKYANIGLITAFFYRKPWSLEIPFFIGMGFYGLFPLLTMPTLLEYALGFISFAALYGVVSFNYALSKYK